MHQYRQNDDLSDLRTGRPPLRLIDFFAAVGAVMVILALYMIAAAADDRAEATEAGARALVATEAEDAYERGMSDAVAALNDGPDSTRLARVCATRGAPQ